MIALLIFNIVLTIIAIVAIIVTINLLIDGKIDANKGIFTLIGLLLCMCLSVFISIECIEGYRDNVINNYKNNKYIEIVDYRYKTVDNVTTKVDSVFTYKVR